MLHLMEKNSNTGHWHLSKEFIGWLHENNILYTEEAFMVGLSSQHQYGLLFKSDENVMAVKLRWL